MKNTTPKQDGCFNCKHWKNNQSELNYCPQIGFCVCPKMAFETVNGRMIGVYDRRNPKNVPGNPSHDFEHVKTENKEVVRSQYALTTDEYFCCKFHNK